MDGEYLVAHCDEIASHFTSKINSMDSEVDYRLLRDSWDVQRYLICSVLWEIFQTAEPENMDRFLVGVYTSSILDPCPF